MARAPATYENRLGSGAEGLQLGIRGIYSIDRLLLPPPSRGSCSTIQSNKKLDPFLYNNNDYV